MLELNYGSKETLDFWLEWISSRTAHIISKLDSLVFIPCSGSEDPDPDPNSSSKSSFGSSWSPSGLSGSTLDNCQAGIEGGTTGVFETEGNCFLQE